MSSEPPVIRLRPDSLREVTENMERETGIEPVTSSLGSYRRPDGQQKIKQLLRALVGAMRHCWRLLNTILNT